MKPIEVNDEPEAPINQPFTIMELQHALKNTIAKSSKSSPGPDGISYEAMKERSEEPQAYPLKSYNFI